MIRDVVSNIALAGMLILIACLGYFYGEKKNDSSVGNGST